MKRAKLLLACAVSLLTNSICMAMNELPWLRQEFDNMKIGYSSCDSEDSDSTESSYSDSESNDGFQDPLDSETIQNISAQFYQLGIKAGYEQELIDNMIWAIAMPFKIPLGCYSLKDRALKDEHIKYLDEELRKKLCLSQDSTIRFFKGAEELPNEKSFNDNFLECLKADDVETIYGYLSNPDLLDIIIEQRLHRMALWAMIPCPQDTVEALGWRKKIAIIFCNDARVVGDKKARSIMQLLLKNPTLKNWLDDGNLIDISWIENFDMEHSGMSHID